MSAYKISGEVFLDKHDGIAEFDSDTIIGEYPEVNDDIDFDFNVKDDIMRTEEYKLAKDGKYHIYFTGTIIWTRNNRNDQDRGKGLAGESGNRTGGR